MEITRKNFADELPNITKDLKRSCFVGFDAEFTAILSSECFKHRLFDTNMERYNHLKTEVSNMIMTQVGLTMFHYERDHDSYIATGYTFHLCPQVFGDIDQSFIFQASTLKFLCRHNFDFNKFTYEGLPYLSKAEEVKVRENIKNNSLFQNLARSLEIEDEKQLQKYCSAVSEWICNKTEDTMYLDVADPVLRFLVHNELRMRFPNILTTDSLGNSNKILIYKDKNVDGAKGAPMGTLEDNIMQHLLGFSQIIALLELHRKPIMGHNIFLDTVLIHNQFIGPLPNDYDLFKKNINSMFPVIFDTKYISHQMGKKLSYNEVWKSNILQELYEFFSEAKCKKIQHGVNPIRLSKPFNVKQSYHEAGWDSFCAGYCFIRLGHWAACENIGIYRVVGPAEVLAALRPYCNKINVIRGAVPYMSFSEADPPSHRPEWLTVTALRGRPIDLGKVANLLAGYGNIDIKPHGAKSALVAANTKHTADRILKIFKTSEEYRIAYYKKRTLASRLAIWSGALITGSFMLLTCVRYLNTTCYRRV